MDDDKPRPNPGGDDGTDDNSGNSGLPLEWILAVVGAVVAIFAIASAIGLTVSNTSSSPPGQTTCGTSCYGFAKLECPGNRLMGACFGIWTCSNPDHKCGQDGRLRHPAPGRPCDVAIAKQPMPNPIVRDEGLDAASYSVHLRAATLRQRYPGISEGMLPVETAETQRQGRGAVSVLSQRAGPGGD